MTHYTNTKEFKFLWSFNFYSNAYVAVMLGCATFLFGFAYLRIKKLQKMLDNPQNKRLLDKQKRVSKYSLLAVSSLNATVIIGLYTQGNYNTLSCITVIANSLILFFSEVASLYLIISYNL